MHLVCEEHSNEVLLIKEKASKKKSQSIGNRLAYLDANQQKESNKSSIQCA